MSPRKYTSLIWTTFTCCTLALAVIAYAQARKAGLYDTTSIMTFQQSPFPAGMGPGGGAPHTTQVCISQAQIDKYGTVPPQSRPECQVSNVVKKSDGYTADIACSGKMSTKGTVTANYAADGHGKTVIHLAGTMQLGPTAKPVEYTIVNESVFKSADCGAVKPLPTN